MVLEPAAEGSSRTSRRPHQATKDRKKLETFPVHCLIKNTVCQPTPLVDVNQHYQLDAILPFIKKGLVAPVHAGRIQYFTHNWAQITQDP